jgi:hypothetical protein
VTQLAKLRGTPYADLVKESSIRDYFARHLDKVSEGLELVKKEYKIRGYGAIDILCRNDSEGYFGIIELKRGSVSPSKLRDQIARYTAAVRSEFFLETEDIRCIIIGTDFDSKIRNLASHLGNVVLKQLIRTGRGYSLADVELKSVPKMSLDDLLSMWPDRIVLRGWSFSLQNRDSFEKLMERSNGWLTAKGYDALLIKIEALEALPFPYTLAVLTVSPDMYIGRARLDGLVRASRQWIGLTELNMIDTGTLRYWYTKPGAPKILDINAFGELAKLSGDKWREYILSREHHPYSEPKGRWFDRKRFELN